MYKIHTICCDVRLEPVRICQNLPQDHPKDPLSSPEETIIYHNLLYNNILYSYPLLTLKGPYRALVILSRALVILSRALVILSRALIILSRALVILSKALVIRYHQILSDTVVLCRNL